MMRRTLLLCLVSAGTALLLACCSDGPTAPPEPDTLRAVFRDGTDPFGGYYGTRDAVIKDGPSPALYLTNFGTRPLDTLGVVDLAGSLYERRLLVRFDLSSISSCAEVVEAALTLHVMPEDTAALELLAFEATVPGLVPLSWAEGTGGFQQGVSWTTVDGTASWNSEGGDFFLSAMDARTVRGDSSVTFELDGGTVRSWIVEPGTNHGVLVMDGGGAGERFLRVNMREAADPSRRPRLVIRYRPGG